MKRPFFTLITPVYNIERLLSITIESALSQTFKDWEMILVDDGSPDKAGEICDKYASQDSRIKVIHKQNEGLAAARNTGIENAQGKYFLILEGSDRLYDENTLQKIHDVLIAEDIDIYFGKLRDVLEKGLVATSIQEDYCVNGLHEKGGKQLFETLYDNGDILALSSPVNKVFKLDFVKDNQLWFYKGIYHDDDEWIPRAIALSTKSYFTQDVIYDALTWDGCLGKSVSDKSLQRRACDKMLLAEHCCKEIDRRIPEKNTVFKKKFYEYYVRIYISGLTSLNVVKDSECKFKIEESIKKHQQIFKYAGKSFSKNLKVIAFIKKVFGLGLVKKLLLRRYS